MTYPDNGRSLIPLLTIPAISLTLNMYVFYFYLSLAGPWSATKNSELTSLPAAAQGSSCKAGWYRLSTSPNTKGVLAVYSKNRKFHTDSLHIDFKMTQSWGSDKETASEASTPGQVAAFSCTAPCIRDQSRKLSQLHSGFFKDQTHMTLSMSFC